MKFIELNNINNFIHDYIHISSAIFDYVFYQIDSEQDRMYIKNQLYCPKQSSEQEITQMFDNFSIEPVFNLEENIIQMMNSLHIHEERDQSYREKQLQIFQANMTIFKASTNNQQKLKLYQSLTKFLFSKITLYDIFSSIEKVYPSMQTFLMSLLSYSAKKLLKKSNNKLFDRIRFIYSKKQYYRVDHSSQNQLCVMIIGILLNFKPDEKNVESPLGALVSILNENIALKYQIINEFGMKLVEYFCLNFTSRKQIYLNEFIIHPFSQEIILPFRLLDAVIECLVRQYYEESTSNMKEKLIHSAILKVHLKSKNIKYKVLSIAEASLTHSKKSINKTFQLLTILKNPQSIK